MTIHITGDEFHALIKALTDASEKQLIKMIMSDDLWITIREIEKGVYKTVITNEIKMFEQ